MRNIDSILSRAAGQIGESNTTRATRAAQKSTEDSVRMDAGTVTNDEVARSGRTGETTAHIENMLSRERTMDCMMHSLLGDDTIY